MSGDAKQEYFADGMTEELIAKLARVASLRVISSASVREYKDRRRPLIDIGKELNVDAIVDGSVLQADKRVRINIQLIHAATSQLLWADSYEREFQDILVLQNEVASSIAREIHVKLEPEEETQLANAPRVNPQSYEAYLRGLTYSESTITEDNLRLAAQMFQKAVDLDPNFASAHAQLSIAESFLYFTVDHTPARLAKSKAALDRVFELQPGSAEGHMALGCYYYRCLRDYDRALYEIEIAQKTLPNNKSLLNLQGSIFRRQGRFEDALTSFLKLHTLNPRDTPTVIDIGHTYFIMRKYSEAQRYSNLGISLGPDEENSYMLSSLTQINWKGDIESARAILNRAPEKKNSELINRKFWVEFWDRKYDVALDVLSSPYGDPIRKPVYVGLAYLFQNKPDSAHTSFDTARELLEKELMEKSDDYNLHGHLGVAYAGLGRKEDAIREGKLAVDLLPISKDALWGPWAIQNLSVIYVLVDEQNFAIDQLEHLLSIPSSISIPLLRIDPRYDSLRKNPRFQKLVEVKS